MKTGVFWMAALGVGLAALPCRSLENGLALTPPMGWNSWNRYYCGIEENLIKAQAEAMVSSGMRAAGYEYINLDDCWQVDRDADGAIRADPARFPSGMKALADHIHGLGLKFGVYTCIGDLTCAGRPGSRGFEKQDAETYAAWGVDYVKVDYCNVPADTDARAVYTVMRDALAESGRPIVFSICNWGVQSPWLWGPETGNLWRTTGDIRDQWDSVLDILGRNWGIHFAAGPGSWNDPDMLEVGNGGMTEAEYRAHFGLWAIMAAPLLAGNDLTNMSEATKRILTAPEIIAVDQDLLGYQGVRLRDNNGLQVWAKRLTGSGARAVALFNSTLSESEISVDLTEIGLRPEGAFVRDLWARRELGQFTGNFLAKVASHDCAVLKITGTEVAVPPGNTFLGDDPWAMAYSGWGPAERNMSNGGTGAGDGKVITLSGTTYDKGLGVHAPSGIDFLLAGNCTEFSAVVGIDDETGGSGRVVFQVWADHRKLFDSGSVMAGAARPFTVDVTGRQILQLIVTDGGDSNAFDHADWAGARITCSGGPTEESDASTDNGLDGNGFADADEASPADDRESDGGEAEDRDAIGEDGVSTGCGCGSASAGRTLPGALFVLGALCALFGVLRRRPEDLRALWRLRGTTCPDCCKTQEPEQPPAQCWWGQTMSRRARARLHFQFIPGTAGRNVGWPHQMDPGAVERLTFLQLAG